MGKKEGRKEGKKRQERRTNQLETTHHVDYSLQDICQSHFSKDSPYPIQMDKQRIEGLYQRQENS